MDKAQTPHLSPEKWGVAFMAKFDGRALHLEGQKG